MEAWAASFLRAVRGADLELELGPELDVDSGIKFNIVKEGNLQVGWGLEAVFGRRGIDGKSSVKSDCIILYLYALVKQSP